MREHKLQPWGQRVEKQPHPQQSNPGNEPYSIATLTHSSWNSLWPVKYEPSVACVRQQYTVQPCDWTIATKSHPLGFGMDWSRSSDTKPALPSQISRSWECCCYCRPSSKWCGHWHRSSTLERLDSLTERASKSSILPTSDTVSKAPMPRVQGVQCHTPHPHPPLVINSPEDQMGKESQGDLAC